MPKKPRVSLNPQPSLEGGDDSLIGPGAFDPEPDVQPARATLTAHAAQQIQTLLAESARRQVEALKLYEPLPRQAEFHASSAPERIIRGSNRSGKTLSAAVEFARAVTGQDPFRKWKPRGGKFVIVGKDGKHIGHTLWEKIFRPGAFKIIRDKTTGMWRAFRLFDPADLARKAEAVPAPPLIPPRLVNWGEIGWENKRENVPSVVRLHTGWELLFFSSLGKPPQGLDADGGWFDEEIVDANWYPELSTRLVDRGGRFIWSATPQAGTEQLYNLHERAERQAFENQQPRTIEEFVLLLDANPHVEEEQKKALAEKLSEEEREVRIGGEFALLTYKVYPEYDRITHAVSYFQVPHTWTRYAAVDPGRQVCAVLFMAVPPPEEGDFFYLYDEIYLKNADADQFGQAMAEKAKNQNFHAFVIDHHAGRVTEMGSGRTVEDQYTEALRRYGVKSKVTGHQFIWGADNVSAGVEASRDLLRVRPDGTAKLRVLRDAVPNFDYEIRRYRYKRINGLTIDEPETRGAVHLMACLRYLAMYRPRYVAPVPGPQAKGGAIEALKRKLARRREMEGGDTSYVRLGPGKSS